MPKEDYVVIKRIGQGAQGSVYEVKHTATNKVLAMKKIDVSHLSEKEKQSALQEVRVLATLQQHPHPNVMGYKESFVDSGDAMLCLVLEWSSEGSLEDRFDRDKDVGHNNIAGPSTSSAASVQPPPPPPLTENEVWRVFLSVVLALDHVHGLRILHRDVKMANVFLHSHRNTYASAVQVPSTRETSTSSNGGGFAIANDKGPVPRSKRKTLIDRVQLGDFGVSTILKDRSNALTLVGTPYYFSPELCMGKAYSSKSDVWSLGILLFTMLHNRMPFEANNYGALILRIVQQSSIVMPSHATANGSAAGGSGEGYSPILSKLCAWTLQKKEVARPTARDLICHPACLAKALDLELTIPQDVLQNQAVMGAMLTRAGRLRIPPNPSHISTAPMSEQQLAQDAGSRPKTSVTTRANAIPLRKVNILNEQADEETNKKGGWVRSTKPSAGVGVVEQAPPHRVTSPKRMKPPSLQSDQVKNQDSTSARASGPGMYKKERPRGGCGGASVYYIPDNHESNKNDRRPIVVVAAQSDPSTPLTIRTVKHRPGAHSHAEKEHHPAVEPTRPSKQPIKTTKGDIDSVRELPDTVGRNGNENSKRHKGPTNSPEYESQAITLAKRNTTPTSAKNTSESPSFYAEAVAQSFAGIMPPTASHRIEALIREHDSRYASANLNSYSSNNNANEEQTSDENLALNFSGSGGYERIRFSTPRDLSRYLSQQQIELQENEGDAAVSQSEDPTNADESLTTHTYRPGAYYDEQDPYEDVPLTTSEEVVEEILDGETDSDIETSAAVTWRVGNEEGTASGDMIATANSHARPVSANRTSKNSEKPTETLGKANVRHGGGSLPPRPSSATYKQARPLSARQQLVNTMNSTASSVASHDNIPIPIAELTGGKRSFGIGQLSSGTVVSRKTAHSNPSTVQQPKKASLADELILTTDPNTKRVGSSGSDPMRRKDTCVDINCTNASVTTTTTTVDDSERLSDMIQSVELEGAAIAGALIFKKVSDAVRASSQGGGPLLSALGKDSAKVFLSGLGVRDEKKQALLMHLAFRLLFLQGQLHRIQNE